MQAGWQISYGSFQIPSQKVKSFKITWIGHKGSDELRFEGTTYPLNFYQTASYELARCHKVHLERPHLKVKKSMCVYRSCSK